MGQEHGQLLRVFLVSDVHTDYPANAAWASRLRTRFQRGGHGYVAGRQPLLLFGQRNLNSINVLLLAGDVSDDMGIMHTTLRDCAAAFDHVFFSPGNHCLWVRSTSQSTGRHQHAAQ